MVGYQQICSGKAPRVRKMGRRGRAGLRQGLGTGPACTRLELLPLHPRSLGSYAEYAGEINYSPASVEWEARVETPENGFYLWGPNPPEDFRMNYEAESEAWAAHR
jgi:hypothetical protein